MKVDIRPDVESLRMYQGLKYNSWFALGEFVDNAITSALSARERLRALDPAYVLRIDIRFDEEARQIEIVDNAAGIAGEDVPRAIKSASPPKDRRFLSVYGVGMKAAGLWWGNRLTINTSAIGEPVRRIITIDTRELESLQDGWLEVVEEEAPEDEHGTSIRLDALTKNIPARRGLGKVRAFLASMYRNFILDGSVEISVKGQVLSFEYPVMLNAPVWPSTAGPELGSESVVWRREVEVELSTGEVVKGWAGLLAKGSTKGAGFLLTFRGKAILGVGAGTNEGEELYRPSIIYGGGNSYRRQRLVGEFDISAFSKTMTSDAPQWQEEQESEFLSLLRRELTSPPLNLLEQAENFRVTTDWDRENPTAEHATSNAVAAIAATAAEQASLISADFEAPPDSDGSLPVERVSVSKSATISLPVPGGSRMVRVDLVLEEAGSADWLNVYSNDDSLTIRVNEDHPFMLSFAQLPRQQIEPVLRLAIGIGFAEYVDHDHVRTRLNALLRGPLSTKRGLDEEDATD